jgi:hypothetical protein
MLQFYLASGEYLNIVGGTRSGTLTAWLDLPGYGAPNLPLYHVAARLPCAALRHLARLPCASITAVPTLREEARRLLAGLPIYNNHRPIQYGGLTWFGLVWSGLASFVDAR